MLFIFSFNDKTKNRKKLIATKCRYMEKVFMVTFSKQLTEK